MAPQANQARLLLVDDEESIRLTLPPVLEQRGFEVRVAASVPDALVEINSYRFDALITDLNIAEQGDGFLVVSAMRHLQPHCVNLILTGYPALDSAVKAIRTQVDDYLTKPSDVDSLVAIINQKLENRNGNPQLQSSLPAKRDGNARGRHEITKQLTQRDRVDADKIRELTGSLLQLRDDERRKIARELHDSVGQMLAAVAIDLSLLEQEAPKFTSNGAKVFQEATNLVQQTIKEVRTISHLLHPPMLDEAGLASAIRWFLEGYSERSKIAVDLQMPTDFGRLAPDLETTIFRMVQEALTNVHRHSGSHSATVHIARTGGFVDVKVEDYGKGIPEEKLANLQSTGNSGVGIRGMRERVKQFGGTLDINSNGHGSVLIVRLPTGEKAKVARRKSAV